MSMNDAMADVEGRDARAARRAAQPRGPSCRASRRRSCRSRPIAGRALVAVVAIMTFLASLTTGRGHAGARRGQRMAGRGRARGHDPDPPGGRAATSRPTSPRPPPSPARRPASPRCGPIPRRNPRACSSPGSEPGLQLDDLPVPRIDRGADRARRGARSRAIAQDARPSRCRARASTTIAASSTACAPCPAPRLRGGIGVLAAGAGRDRAVGHLRHPRRHGDQPSGDRGAASHRRQGQLHRRAFPAAFPALG